MNDKLKAEVYKDIKKGTGLIKKKVSNHHKRKKYLEKMQRFADHLVEEMLKSEYVFFETSRFVHYLKGFNIPVDPLRGFYVSGGSRQDAVEFLLNKSIIQVFRKYKNGILKQYILCDQCNSVIEFIDKINHVVGKCNNCNNDFGINHNCIYKRNNGSVIYQTKHY